MCFSDRGKNAIKRFDAIAVRLRDLRVDAERHVSGKIVKTGQAVADKTRAVRARMFAMAKRERIYVNENLAHKLGMGYKDDKRLHEMFQTVARESGAIFKGADSTTPSPGLLMTDSEDDHLSPSESAAGASGGRLDRPFTAVSTVAFKTWGIVLSRTCVSAIMVKAGIKYLATKKILTAPVVHAHYHNAVLMQYVVFLSVCFVSF